MARKSIDITISDDGRDKGKIFHIREMSAWDAEWWATRALLALAKSNADLGNFQAGAGMATLASMAFSAFLRISPEDAKPLLDEMMTCVQIKPNRKHPELTRALLEEDIEEMATIFKLRREVFNLHLGFSSPGND